MAKALQLSEVKGELRLASVTKPTPAGTQILVEHVAVAQNPIDWKQQEMGFYINSFPYVLGFDVAGIVADVGPDVTKFQKGDRVVVTTEFLEPTKHIDGAFQTHSIHTEDYASKIPENVSFEEASSIPLGLFTAACGMYGHSLLPDTNNGTEHKGEWYLVWAAATSVGAYAIQLARLLGFRVVATASPHSFEYVKSLGAEVVFDYRDEQIVEKIRELTGGKLQHAFQAFVVTEATAKIGKAMSTEGGEVAMVDPRFSDFGVVPENVKLYPFNAFDVYNVSCVQ
jgi:NADPH:quinone reductase-like Zn-dependent oxidoreductase